MLEVYEEGSDICPNQITENWLQTWLPACCQQAIQARLAIFATSVII
jgi:hypothetical protein